MSHYHRWVWYWSFIQDQFGVDVKRYLRYIWLGPHMVLEFLIPVCIIIALREPLKSYGLGLGKVKRGLKMCLLFYALYAPLFVIFFMSQGFQEHYTESMKGIETWQQFWFKEAPSVFLFMVKTEFLYRGFLLFGIRKRYGDYAGILCSMIPFVMFHFNKPEIETFGSFPVGLALAYLAVRTESIWYGVFLHASIALMLNGLLLFLR